MAAPIPLLAPVTMKTLGDILSCVCNLRENWRMRSFVRAEAGWRCVCGWGNEEFGIVGQLHSRHAPTYTTSQLPITHVGGDKMTTTVILGSGVIVLSTAFYLSKHQPGSSIHLVDSSSELFASASGYAGGFVAKDWFQSSVASLGELSFNEHKRLAEKEGGRQKWEYSASVTLSLASRRRRPSGKTTEDWLLEDASRAELVRQRGEEADNGAIPRWLRMVDGDAVNVVDDGSGTAIV